MRTTIDLPEATLRQLKARADMAGVSTEDLVLDFIERGLTQLAAAPRQAKRSALPALVPNKPLALRRPSNAQLFEALHQGDVGVGATERPGSTA